MFVHAMRKWCHQFKNELTSVFYEVCVSTDELPKKIDARVQENSRPSLVTGLISDILGNSTVGET